MPSMVAVPTHDLPTPLSKHCPWCSYIAYPGRGPDHGHVVVTLSRCSIASDSKNDAECRCRNPLTARAMSLGVDGCQRGDAGKMIRSADLQHRSWGGGRGKGVWGGMVHTHAAEDQLICWLSW